MYHTIKEAAHLLGVSENRVRKAIASGKLAVERKGRQILIHETELKAFAENEKSFEVGEHEARSAPEMASAAPSLAAIDRIAARLAVLEGQLTEKWERVAENQHLQELLCERDRQLAAKDLELEKLHRDLVYQQRLAEKELEEHRQACQERLGRLEREAAARTAQEREREEETLAHERQTCSERLAREREQAVQALAQERQHWSEKLEREQQVWSEKLAQEQERFAHMLAATRNQEGLWARLVRMITWS